MADYLKVHRLTVVNEYDAIDDTATYLAMSELGLMHEVASDILEDLDDYVAVGEDIQRDLSDIQREFEVYMANRHKEIADWKATIEKYYRMGGYSLDWGIASVRLDDHRED